MTDDRAEDLEKTKKEVHAIIENLGDSIPFKARPMIEEAIVKMKVENLLPKDVLGFTPEMMELVYKYGYNLFQSGKYQQAVTVFNTLRQLDITDPRYSFSIAACYHHMHQYLDAAANYIIYKYMDPLNPIPCFHLYDCYTKANYPISALAAIQEALILAERDPKYAGLKEKIQLEFNRIKETLKENFKDKQEPPSKGGSA
jgi:type III secretion system low calcium response chaperone LcrH/SycD